MQIDKDKILAAADYAYAKHSCDSIPSCLAATFTAALEAMVAEVNEALKALDDINRNADQAASDACARSLSSSGDR